MLPSPFAHHATDAHLTVRTHGMNPCPAPPPPEGVGLRRTQKDRSTAAVRFGFVRAHPARWPSTAASWHRRQSGGTTCARPSHTQVEELVSGTGSLSTTPEPAPLHSRSTFTFRQSVSRPSVRLPMRDTACLQERSLEQRLSPSGSLTPTCLPACAFGFIVAPMLPLAPKSFRPSRHPVPPRSHLRSPSADSRQLWKKRAFSAASPLLRTTPQPSFPEPAFRASLWRVTHRVGLSDSSDSPGPFTGSLWV